jgi:zinc protease
MKTSRLENTKMQKRTLAVGAVLALCLTPGLVQAQATEQAPTAATGVTLKNRAPVAKDVLQIKLPRPQEFTLPSGGNAKGGARVLVVEDHKLPLLTISVSVRAGSLFEDPQKPGVAAFTASMLTEGTQSRDYEAIAAATEKIGASLNASAGEERATVSVSGLSDNVDDLVSLLADVLLHPTFPAERLARAQFRATAQYAQQASSPQFLSGQLSREVLYGATTPYGRPAPNPDQIKSITPDDLKAFYTAHYLNLPTTLIGVAGDVKASDIQKKLTAALAGWQGGGTDAVLPPGTFTPKDKTQIFLVDRPNSAQTFLTFANLGIKRTDPDYFPLTLANYILGGSFNSRLNDDLREQKGYTYGVSSSVSAPKYPGTWTMGGSVRNAVTALAVGAFYDEFTKMQSGAVTQTELATAKRAIIGRFALTLESPAGVLGRLIDVVDYGLPSDYWDTYPQKIQAVTADDVLRVTKTYLGTGRVQLFAVGDKASIESGLTQYGTITDLTPEQVLGPATQ